jgi:hypothetical protein
MRRPRKGWLLPPVLGMLLGLLLALTPSLGPCPAQHRGTELQVFVREGCPHCAAAKAFLPELQKPPGDSGAICGRSTPIRPRSTT